MKYNITGKSITIYIDDDARTYDRTSSIGVKLVDAIRSEYNDEKIEHIIYAFKNEIESLHEDIEVGENDYIKFKNEDVPRELGLMMKEFSNDGIVLKPLVNFWNKLKENPDQRCITRLFECTQSHHFPICKDGDFIAWKRVRGILDKPETFVDLHSGKFSNTPGKVVKVEREEVDSNPEKICSYGLHVANFNFCKKYYTNGIMLEVKISPLDVVCLPYYENYDKIRICKYKVLKVVNDMRTEKVYSGDEWDVDENEFKQLI